MSTGEAGFVSVLPQVGDTEVDQLVGALSTLVLMRDDVGRLDVAMDDIVAVRELECRTDTRNDAVDIVDIHAAASVELVAQAWTAEQLHHQVRLPARRHVEVEDRHDRRMPQAGGDPALAEEAIARAALGVIAENHLDGDLVTEERAPGPIHRAHAALSEWRENLVPVVEDVACRQHATSLNQWQGLGGRGRGL